MQRLKIYCNSYVDNYFIKDVNINYMLDKIIIRFNNNVKHKYYSHYFLCREKIFKLETRYNLNILHSNSKAIFLSIHLSRNILSNIPCFE